MTATPNPQKQYSDLHATTFGPLDKYVAANDNVPQDESGQSAGFEIDQRQDSDPKPRGFFAGLTTEQKERVLRGEGEPHGGASLGDPAFRRRIGDFMQVYSGRQYWPMDPRPDEVHIEDIAHSLSLQCRYAGHCIQFYSVAEHSVHIARWLDKHYGPVTAIHGLLHDATEAYCVDVPRPLKPSLTNYKQIEASNWVAIAKRFHLANELPAAVHEADNRIIADELVNLRPMAWHAQHNDPLGVSIGRWSPEDAEDEFLAEYVRLERKRGRA